MPNLVINEVFRCLKKLFPTVIIKEITNPQDAYTLQFILMSPFLTDSIIIRISLSEELLTDCKDLVNFIMTSLVPFIDRGIRKQLKPPLENPWSWQGSISQLKSLTDIYNEKDSCYDYIVLDKYAYGGFITTSNTLGEKYSLPAGPVHSAGSNSKHDDAFLDETVKPGKYWDSLTLLRKAFPGLTKYASYPCKCTKMAPGHIYDIIIHLNDFELGHINKKNDKDWTREDIADWLETLDVNLEYQEKEEQNDDNKFLSGWKDIGYTHDEGFGTEKFLDDNYLGP